jgi:PhzF family phenazine biosynthesis protein
MTPRRFMQVDVFTAQVLQGNPLAVVLDAQGLDDAAMQALARWTQLSETSFVLPATQSGADYRVRIFTPGGELPFAGHPTLGTCYAWLAAGGVPRDAGRVVQECGIGQVQVRRAGARLAFAAPRAEMRSADAATVAPVLQALGLQPAQCRRAAWLNSGWPQLALELDSAATVLALRPDHALLKTLGHKVGVVGRHGPGGPGLQDADFEVRFFAAAMGIAEDPVTGSFNGNLAQWLIGDGRATPRYVAAQGTCLGRAGRVHVEHDGHDFWIGGDVQPCITGQLRL